MNYRWVLFYVHIHKRNENRTLHQGSELSVEWTLNSEFCLTHIRFVCTLAYSPNINSQPSDGAGWQSKQHVPLICTHPRSEISFTNSLTGIREWVNNHIHCFMQDVIILPCPCFNGSLPKQPLKLAHLLMIASHSFMGIYEDFVASSRYLRPG